LSPAWRTPLPRLLARSIERAVNGVLRFDEAARERLAALPAGGFAAELPELALALVFTADRAHVHVAAIRQAGESAAVIRGSAPALAGLAFATGARTGKVTIRGDAELAQAWQAWFAALSPDFEEALCRILGDVAGHQLAAALRGLFAGTRRRLTDGAAMAAEYLTEEAAILPTAGELSDFYHEVDWLRDAAARLEARLAARQRRLGDQPAARRTAGLERG